MFAVQVGGVLSQKTQLAARGRYTLSALPLKQLGFRFHSFLGFETFA